MKLLPDYEPPHWQRAAFVAGVAPIVVLLTFTLIVARVIHVEVGLALFAASTVWLVHEQWVYQRSLDAYNAHYVHRYLQWRSAEA